MQNRRKSTHVVIGTITIWALYLSNKFLLSSLPASIPLPQHLHKILFHAIILPEFCFPFLLVSSGLASKILVTSVFNIFFPKFDIKDKNKCKFWFFPFHYKISREKFEPESRFEPRTSEFLAQHSTT